MGCCFSIRSEPDPSSPAALVYFSGTIRAFPVPVTALQVLKSDTTIKPSSSFLCSASDLHLGSYIGAIHPQQKLESGRIYLRLPVANLGQRLTLTRLAELEAMAEASVTQVSPTMPEQLENAICCPDVPDLNTLRMDERPTEDLGRPNVPDERPTSMLGSELAPEDHGLTATTPFSTSVEQDEGDLGDHQPLLVSAEPDGEDLHHPTISEPMSTEPHGEDLCPPIIFQAEERLAPSSSRRRGLGKKSRRQRRKKNS